MTDKERIADLQKRLTRTYDQRNQCLTALRSAKKLIRFWYIISEYKKVFWKEYQNDPKMQQINKAIKDGKV